jgi:hypothetical protein
LTVPLHRPFFVALGTPDSIEKSPRWRATAAGLVILRLVDRRIEHAGDLILIDADSIGHRRLPQEIGADEAWAATRKVREIGQDTGVTAPLRVLVRAVLYRPHADIAPPLVRYAEALESTEQWALAADVYDTIIRLAQAPPLRDAESFRTLRRNAIPRRSKARKLAGTRRH